MGVYYLRKGNLEEAKKHFDFTLKNQDIPIDFLEFHYSELLFKLGDNENALKFLEKSTTKGEQIATERFTKMK